MERLRRLRQSWPVFALGVFYIYLAFHALSGSQGLVSWAEYESDIANYQVELQLLHAEKEKLEVRADRLKAAQLDLDVLDIEARKKVFLSHPDEITIWLDPTP